MASLGLALGLEVASLPKGGAVLRGEPEKRKLGSGQLYYTVQLKH